MRIATMLAVFFIFTSALAQKPNLDSLLGVWNDNAQADSNRVNAYKTYIWDKFIYDKPDTAIILAEVLQNYAQKHNYPKASGLGYALQGTANWFMSNYIEATERFEKAIKIYEELDHKAGIAPCLISMGSIYQEQGNYPLALEYFQKALTLNEELGKRSSVAMCLNNIGINYKTTKNYNMALEYYEKSLKIKEELGDKRGVAGGLHNIGVIYDDLGNRQLALEYYLKAKAINEETGNKKWLASNLNNIGIIYNDQGKYNAALECYETSMRIDEELGNLNGLAATLNNVGFMYKNQGKNNLALEYCNKGLELSKKINSLQWQKSSCLCLYLTYKELGNTSKALSYYEEMVLLKDSIYNDENTKKLTQLEMQYEFDKEVAASKAEQEKKDAVAAQELKQQMLLRNGFIGGFVVVLLFAGIFLAQRNRIGKEKKRSEELLLNILPEEVAEELKDKGHSDAQLIEHVTVLFTDFKGFTALSEQISPKELVADLHACFSEFDRICEKHGIEKIKTIGDAYMAAGGLPTPNTTHASDVVKVALEMALFVENGKAMKFADNKPFFEIRIGVHTGPVVAGIVGIKKFQYDIWGDTVNTASRMESSGEVGKVNISESTFEILKNDANFSFKSRGKIEAKGKGEIGMYFASNA